MSQQNIRQFERDANSKNPFAKPPKPDRDQQEDKGVPGSDWGQKQIEWLGVKWEWDCVISEMFSRDSEFQPNCVLQRLIVNNLNKPWEEIKNEKDLDQTTLYARLSYLTRKLEPLGEYDGSSTIQEPGSQSTARDRSPLSTFSPQRKQEPRTPVQHMPSSPAPMPLTPRRKRQFQAAFSSPLSSRPATPPSYAPRSKRQALVSTAVSQNESPDEERSNVEELVDDDDLTRGEEQAQHHERGDDDFQGCRGSRSVLGLPQLPPRLSPEQLHRGSQETENQTHYLALSSYAGRRSSLRRPKAPINYAPEPTSSETAEDLRNRSSSTDPDYHLGSSQAPPETPPGKGYNIRKAQLDEEHKPEDEVQDAARAFLNELSNIFHKRYRDIDQESGVKWGLELIKDSGKTEKFKIDPYSIEANADAGLTVTAQDRRTEKPLDRQVRLLIECKPAKHSLTIYDIFGQEVAEMLAEAMRLRAYHPIDRYTVFLVSWHHLDCYFSRMDVTNAYLAQLKDTSDLPSQERPHVRQSKKLSLKVDSERVEVGETCARMVIDMLAAYKRPRQLGVIQFLKA